jgi:hypothetical protein
MGFMKIWRVSQSVITSYHGTCEGLYKIILEEDGLKNPYLARDINLAKYYAEEASTNYRCGKPIVLEVKVIDINGLRYDKNSMDEPVMTNVGDRDSAWDKASIEHPEWVNGGIISIPEEEWEISWDAVGSARYKGVIPLDNIMVIG